MNWQTMPPLAALRAFEAFAETGNVTTAGRTLNVSHAAISQHIRGLEQHLGTALVDRAGRTLTLTVAGVQLADAVQSGFGQISRVIEALSQADQARPLHVSTTPTFAGSWLMPRLADFRDHNPDIDIMIDASPQIVTLSPGGIDVAIRYGAGPWTGYESELLLASPMVLVAAPGLIGDRRVEAPADLSDAPWLEEIGTTEASRWLSDHGVVPGRERRMIQLPGNMVLDAARNCQGVAVTVRAFVEADLQAGRLVELFRQNGPAQGYHIVTRPGLHRPPLRAFLRWLKRQKAINQTAEKGI